MPNKQIRETYRQHEIIARHYKGTYHGRAWKGKEVIFETTAETLEIAANALRQYVDELITGAAISAGSTPDDAKMLEGFRLILSKLHDGQLAMLKAHYYAVDQMLTATELAAAAGYDSYVSANYHYGIIGKNLYELFPFDLPKHKDNTLIYTYYFATGPMDENQAEEEWKWVLRPEAAKAIEILGLHA